MKMKKIAGILLVVVLLAVLAVNVFLLIETEKENRAYEAAQAARIEAEAQLRAEEEAEAMAAQAVAEAEVETIEAEKATQYEKALLSLKAKDYEAAYALFLELGNYKDSAEYAADFFILREGTCSVPYPGVTERALYLPDGRLLWEEVHLAEEPETLLRRTDREYDEDGTVTQIVQSFADGTITTTEHDPAGNITAQSVENTETGEITATAYENVFYESGILQQQTTVVYNPANNYEETFVFHYDKYGKLISTDASVYTGKYEDQYIYNERGELVLRKRLLEGYVKKHLVNEESKEFYTWSYDEKGNILTQKQYNGLGALRWYHTYSYEDILGTPILTEHTRCAGNTLVEEARSYTARLIYGPDL